MKTKLSTLLALTPAAVAALNPIQAEAANYYLKLDGIAGESTDKMHKEWIDLQSWSFGLTADSSWTKGGGASVGKPNPGPMAITFTLNKASPTLYSTLSSGKVISSATLAAAKNTSAGSTTDFYTIKLEGVYLTSAKTGGSSGDIAGPVETFTMIYRSAVWSYSTLDSKGTVSGKPVTFGWDFVDSKAK